MHGVQPIAKIAPRPNDASQPPFESTMRLAEPVGHAGDAAVAPGEASETEPVTVASDCVAPASRGRHVRSRAAIGRMPGEGQAHDDEDQATDDPQRGQVVGERPGAGRSR